MTVETEKKKLIDYIAKSTMTKLRKMAMIDLVNNLERQYMYEIEKAKTPILEQVLITIKTQTNESEKADHQTNQ